MSQVNVSVSCSLMVLLPWFCNIVWKLILLEDGTLIYLLYVLELWFWMFLSVSYSLYIALTHLRNCMSKCKFDTGTSDLIKPVSVFFKCSKQTPHGFLHRARYEISSTNSRLRYVWSCHCCNVCSLLLHWTVSSQDSLVDMFWWEHYEFNGQWISYMWFGHGNTIWRKMWYFNVHWLPISNLLN